MDELIDLSSPNVDTSIQRAHKRRKGTGLTKEVNSQEIVDLADAQGVSQDQRGLYVC